MHDGWMVESLTERVDQGLPLLLSTLVHYLAVLERLGIIWLLYCTSLAVCARAWLLQGLT